MKGKLHKTKNGWYVIAIEEGDWNTHYPIEESYSEGQEVDFDIVTIDNGDNGVRYATIIKSEYPELEGTNRLCEDIIAARANESVPAPGDSETELRRVRQDKNRHVKANNWELAALYREIEKLLEREPKCANCANLLHAVGVGQGLVCDLNKLKIPHSEWCCDRHEYKSSDKTCKNDKF